MYEIFWEMGQQARIDGASDTASRAQYQADAASARVMDLETENHRLLLIVRALWEIVQAQHGLDNDVLAKKIQEIDLRDGVLDGRYVKAEVRKCSACGRVMNRKHRQCLYCGEKSASDDAIGG